MPGLMNGSNTVEIVFLKIGPRIFFLWKGKSLPFVMALVAPKASIWATSWVARGSAKLPTKGGGIHPVNPVFSSFRCSKLARLPNSGGSSPTSLGLSNRFSSLSSPRLPSSGGNSPLNESDSYWVGFWLRPSTFNLERLPSSGGIIPLKWFLLRFNSSRASRSPTSVGMPPINSLLSSDSL